MLTVWGRKTSSNIQALMWCIEKMELPYVRNDIWHKYKGTETDFSIHLPQTGQFRFCIASVGNGSNSQLLSFLKNSIRQ